MSAPPPRSRRALPLVVILLLLALGIAGGVWFAAKARNNPPNAQANQKNEQPNAGQGDRRNGAQLPKLDAAAAAELVRLNNLGLGRLENAEAFEGKLGLAEQAAPAFEEITKRQPDLVLGPRNLTVARLMALAGGADPALLPVAGQQPAKTPAPEAVSAAKAAVASLKHADPKSAVSGVLAARIAALAGDFDAARAALKEAAQAAPDEAWVHYERFRLDRYAPDELRREAEDALGQAHRAAPRNLWVARDWMSILADRQSPDLVAVIDTTRDTLAPLAEGIKQRTRTDVLDLLAQAKTAASNRDWRAALSAVRRFINVTIREEQTQSDKRAVDRNALEFIEADFPASFYESAGLPRRPAPKAVPVTFAPTDLPPAIANLRDIRDAQLADFDLDGKLDLVVLSGRTLAAYRLGAEAGQTPILSYDLPGDFNRFLPTDLDLDATDDACRQSADLDVVLSGPAGILVLESRPAADGARTLAPVEQPQALASVKNVLATAAADFDHDGDLDLVVSADGGLTLWANAGALKFEDRTPRTDLPPQSFKPTTILPIDLDRDADLDLVLAGADGPAGYMENLRHGNLRWRECGSKAPARAVEPIDADGNASWDLLAAGAGELTLLTSQTPRPGRWLVKSAETAAPGAFDRLWQLDYDNDGLADLLARRADKSGSPVLLRNAGGRFEQAAALNELGAPLIAADFGDTDGDGDLDLLLASADGVRLAENRGGNANGWVDLALVAAQIKGGDVASASLRVNHAGLGSLVELKAGPTYVPAVVRKPVTHFGLGGAAKPEVLRVLWTNGIPQNVLEPATNQSLCEKQSLKGSCPYLYTFDGEKFVFSTDLLWSAPIGLVFAEGVPAPTRAWEYLKITSPLRPDADGRYALAITEELWEAAYFDQVELIAVDHPPDVEVFTNEKVGPAELAAPRLYTVTHPRRPVRATDGKSRDVTPLLASRDEQYVKAFDDKYAQGLCEPHSLELDFGDLADAQRVVLYLTGWVYPSDTSINVALGQRSDLPKPKPPSLSVPNERGEWVEVLPYMGFPGGKTKTIAIDLTGKFLSGDRRVRIDSTMELYWDEAFVTADEPAVALVTKACPLAAADLHSRGVSAPVEHPQHGPERYDYARVSTDPAWPPMDGLFTRYGDVKELLTAADDLQVVMTSGDEITLRFDAPPGPPPGWTRSFVLHNVGYDKDADLNTVYGQTAEPLPFRDMAAYPYEPGQSFPDTPAHRRFLADYQTRTVPQRAFWTAIRDFENPSPSIPASSSSSVSLAP